MTTSQDMVAGDSLSLTLVSRFGLLDRFLDPWGCLGVFVCHILLSGAFRVDRGFFSISEFDHL